MQFKHTNLGSFIIRSSNQMSTIASKIHRSHGSGVSFQCDWFSFPEIFSSALFRNKNWTTQMDKLTRWEPTIWRFCLLKLKPISLLVEKIEDRWQLPDESNQCWNTHLQKINYTLCPTNRNALNWGLKFHNIIQLSPEDDASCFNFGLNETEVM